MLIIAPLINVYGTHESEDKMALLNDVSLFLDKVTDKGSITEYDLNEFYMQVESHGMVLNVEVKRLVKTTVMLPDNTISTTYISADDISKLNPRDIIQVKLKEISSTPYKKLISTVLRLNTQKYELCLAKMVR